MFKPSLRVVGGIFPIYRWSRNYDLSTAVGDLIAGITVALTLVPQSIAYASLAGLEPQYGLYASFVGGIVYAFLGTSPQINIGPSALLSLLTFTYTNGTNPDFALLLCLIGGIVQVIAGVARLGFLVEFVSLPVVSGFTSAAAVTIASSQIKGLLGLRFSSEGFIATWVGVVNHIGDIRLADTLLSLACCIFLTGMKMLKDVKVKIPDDEKMRNSAIYLNRFLWFFGVARNAVVVALATAIAFFVHETQDEPIILTGNITPGMPTPQPPPFSSQVGNTTYTGPEMLGYLGSGLVVVPLVGIISNVAIAKAFAKGKSLDATQEIIALGLCNVIGSFFRSFPVNGSFSRSAVSDASGVRTPAAGFYTGFIVILTLLLLTPYFYFIPRATLASVIICAVLHMVDVEIIKKLWKTNKLDLIPLLGTFLLCLGLGIEIGLICGVAIDAVLLMYYQSRPSLDIKYVNDGVLPPHHAIHPVAGLHFAGADRAKSQILALMSNKHSNITCLPQTIIVVNEASVSNRVNEVNGEFTVNGVAKRTRDLNGVPLQIISNGTVPHAGTIYKNILVVYCESLNFMDYTFLQSIKTLVTEWNKTGIVIWCDVKPGLKKQLDEVLSERPCYCERQQLRHLLLSTEENTRNGDTHL